MGHSSLDAQLVASTETYESQLLTTLQRQLISKQKPGTGQSFQLQYLTRNYIHAAIKRAQDAGLALAIISAS